VQKKSLQDSNISEEQIHLIKSLQVARMLIKRLSVEVRKDLKDGFLSTKEADRYLEDIDEAQHEILFFTKKDV